MLNIDLNDSRKNLIWDLLTILNPVILIFIGTSLIISPGPISKKEIQIHWVEQRQNPCFGGNGSWDTPEKCRKDLRNVVNVTSMYLENDKMITIG